MLPSCGFPGASGAIGRKKYGKQRQMVSSAAVALRNSFAAAPTF
jgi:hypothetical protein